MAPVGDERSLPATIRSAIALYGFAEESETELLSLSENATYRIVDGAGRVAILRVHRTVTSL